MVEAMTVGCVVVGDGTKGEIRPDPHIAIGSPNRVETAKMFCARQSSVASVRSKSLGEVFGAVGLTSSRSGPG